MRPVADVQINVYELGATYLKLRSCLNLDQILPEIDPAVYNIRFANRLDFGPASATVARDASRLIKRFKADWMTAGRRPAGICGACLVIAARMSDFLRTPEEVAQVVKVSPLTIKKRLVEFAGTAAANKTVEEWRALTDADLEAENADELPPIMKKQLAKMAAQKEKERVKRERSETADSRASTPASPRKRSKLSQASDDTTNAIQAVAEGVDIESSGADEADEGMEPLAKEDYVKDIQDAGDNSEEAVADRKRERRMLMASLKEADGEEADEEELQEMAVDEDAPGQDSKEDEAGEGSVLAEVAPAFNPLKDLPAPPDFKDKEALYAYCEKHIFTSEDLLYAGNTAALRQKIDDWVKGRDPTEVVNEMRRVVWARNEREWFAKHHREDEFEDLDDDELDKYWVMSEDERQTRARMWLSHNGKWLEEDKERQERKAEYNRQHGIDPNKPQPKKKKRKSNAEKQKGPYVSTHAAMEAFASQKKFSTRINQEVLKRISQGEGLQRMDDDYDEDDKEDDEKDDEKYDEKEDDLYGYVS